jgi:gas vesicle protein
LAARNKRESDKRESEVRVIETHKNWQPEKVVIVAGPSFGSAISFVLFGAILGAAGALFWSAQRTPSTQSGTGAVREGVTGDGAREEARAAQMMQRLSNLARSVRSLASRARESAQHAGEVLGPAIKEAVSEAKTVAQETQQDIEQDIRHADVERNIAKEQA